MSSRLNRLRAKMEQAATVDDEDDMFGVVVQEKTEEQASMSFFQTDAPPHSEAAGVGAVKVVRPRLGGLAPKPSPVSGVGTGSARISDTSYGSGNNLRLGSRSSPEPILPSMYESGGSTDMDVERQAKINEHMAMFARRGDADGGASKARIPSWRKALQESKVRAEADQRQFGGRRADATPAGGGDDDDSDAGAMSLLERVLKYGQKGDNRSAAPAPAPAQAQKPRPPAEPRKQEGSGGRRRRTEGERDPFGSFYAEEEIADTTVNSGFGSGESWLLPSASRKPGAAPPQTKPLIDPSFGDLLQVKPHPGGRDRVWQREVEPDHTASARSGAAALAGLARDIMRNDASLDLPQVYLDTTPNGMYSQQPGMYPPQPGMYPPHPSGMYPQQPGMYPQQPGMIQYGQPMDASMLEMQLGQQMQPMQPAPPPPMQMQQLAPGQAYVGPDGIRRKPMMIMPARPAQPPQQMQGPPNTGGRPTPRYQEHDRDRDRDIETRHSDKPRDRRRKSKTGGFWDKVKKAQEVNQRHAQATKQPKRKGTPPSNTKQAAGW